MTQTAENNTVEEEILSWQSFSEILHENDRELFNQMLSEMP